MTTSQRSRNSRLFSDDHHLSLGSLFHRVRYVGNQSLQSEKNKSILSWHSRYHGPLLWNRCKFKQFQLKWPFASSLCQSVNHYRYPAGYSTLSYNFDFFNYAGIHRLLWVEIFFNCTTISSELSSKNYIFTYIVYCILIEQAGDPLHNSKGHSYKVSLYLI